MANTAFPSRISVLNGILGLLRMLMRSPTSAFGLAVILLLCLIAIFAPLIATHDPYVQNLENVLQPPGSGHLFGTDALGRDIFSRVIHGARISLTIIAWSPSSSAPSGCWLERPPDISAGATIRR